MRMNPGGALGMGGKLFFSVFSLDWTCIPCISVTVYDQ